MLSGDGPSNLGQIIGRLMLAAAGERLAPVSARARELAEEVRQMDAQRRAEDVARRRQSAREAEARAKIEAQAEALRRAEAKAKAAAELAARAKSPAVKPKAEPRREVRPEVRRHVAEKDAPARGPRRFSPGRSRAGDAPRKPAILAVLRDRWLGNAAVAAAVGISTSLSSVHLSQLLDAGRVRARGERGAREYTAAGVVKARPARAGKGR